MEKQGEWGCDEESRGGGLPPFPTHPCRDGGWDPGPGPAPPQALRRKLPSPLLGLRGASDPPSLGPDKDAPLQPTKPLHSFHRRAPTGRGASAMYWGKLPLCLHSRLKLQSLLPSWPKGPPRPSLLTLANFLWTINVIVLFCYICAR